REVNDAAPYSAMIPNIRQTNIMNVEMENPVTQPVNHLCQTGVIESRAGRPFEAGDAIAPEPEHDVSNIKRRTHRRMIDGIQQFDIFIRVSRINDIFQANANTQFLSFVAQNAQISDRMI